MKRDSLNEATMYAGITRRDRSLDGQFVYAVLTTGVYCCPSCSARTPLRENVRFFSSSEEADVAGFRACKRCKPDDPHYGVAHLVELARYIVAHAEEKLPLKTLAAKQGVSPGYLQRTFKAVFGISPKAFQDAARLNTLKNLLKTGDDITGAIFEAGYGAPSRFYENAARQIGMSPKAYRDGGSGETITYACRDTDLGALMMAATDKGVCFVMFGDNESSLLDQLQAEFPKAKFSQSPNNDGKQLDAWMMALDNHLRKGTPRPDIPLDLRGTAFQIKVWQFLLSIPEGDVVSYSEVAEAIDKPRAVRAAASACGKNRIAVLVPCHRVLRGDGSLGGYRWGLERKRTLLDTERGKRSKS
ncbi:MAG: bifunctional DNA-binding transcriptional regulator/O6-methylguanine-DNA methyltransferase Ada [Pseudomonadales bacterium]|nr:bifunctional DNA-binding transcriptional regulator/O6-methylguanine-DNA methyltransferase Ada [Pseudomonadales bacterium]